jgi:hypothetical protein
MQGFLGLFDPEEGTVTKMRQSYKDAGLVMEDFNIGGSLDELVATSSLMSSTQKSFESGELALADVTGFVQNIEKVAEISAQAASTGTPLDADFQKNLIKNAENASEIGNVDFTDPSARVLLELKAEFPALAAAIDQNKEQAQRISKLVNMVSPVGGQLDSAYMTLLLEDLAYFESIAPTLIANPQLPAQLFVELKKLTLAPAELTKVLADIQVGPQAAPPGSPPSQVAQLSLQNEASMLNLLNDQSFTNGVLDPTLLVASEQVLASVFFTETSSAFTALSNLDRTQNSTGSSASADLQELTLGARDISFSSGQYLLSSSSPSDFLIASTNKMILTGNLVFNSSSPESELILLSAAAIDLSGANSITFGGYSLGMGSFDSLQVKNVDLKSDNEISLRSLDNVVINNVAMETSGKGADFIHLLAANELQVNNLRFSDSVKQIAMEAMTINLSNVNFPSSSSVKLNSLYGGMDGKYPNFNSVLHGRVNFVEQVRYGTNLIMDRTSFDTHGGKITIGSK